MARSPQDVTDKELEILQVLWDQGPATIRQIADLLHPEGGAPRGITLYKNCWITGRKSRQRRRHQQLRTFVAAVAR